MSEETTSQRRSEEGVIEFYVPATFQFSVEPGRIERILVGLFHDRGDLEARIVTEEPTREFYTPAMYQFSTEPGRLERFLDAVFTERGEQEFTAVPESFVDVFYLPATDPAEFRRRDSRNHVPVVPAAEALEEKEHRKNPSK
jgi:hypothetical protein